MSEIQTRNRTRRLLFEIFRDQEHGPQWWYVVSLDDGAASSIAALFHLPYEEVVRLFAITGFTHKWGNSDHINAKKSSRHFF